MRCADFRVFSLRVQGPQPLPPTAQVILPSYRRQRRPALTLGAGLSPAVQASPRLRARFFRLLLVIQNALAVRAEMYLPMLLNLVVQLWRQPHPASLAGSALRQGNRDAGAPVENHLVAREQICIDMFGDLLARLAMLADVALELFDFGRDFLFRRRQIDASLAIASVSSLIRAIRASAPSIDMSNSLSSR